MIRRFGLLCVLLALLIFSGVLTAQSNDLRTHIWEGRHRVCGWEDSGERRRGVGLMAKRTIERPLGDPKI
jgi:hypothetical protein